MNTITILPDVHEKLAAEDTFVILTEKKLPPAIEAMTINDLQRDVSKLVAFGNHHKAIEFAWNLYKTKKDSKHCFVHHYKNQYEMCLNFSKKLASVDQPEYANFSSRLVQGYALFVESEIEEKFPLGAQEFKTRFITLLSDRMEIMIKRHIAELTKAKGSHNHV